MTKNERKCIGCCKLANRENMFRIMIKHDTKEIVLSPTNKDFGRSVYICKNKSCVENSFKKGKISRYIKQDNIEKLKETLLNLLIY